MKSLRMLLGSQPSAGQPLATYGVWMLCHIHLAVWHAITAFCACLSPRPSLPHRSVPSLLQGTPIQNNLEELWSLVDFALQGTLLGTRRVFNKGE